ncbi:MlaD family protein [Nocardia goodfellowii]|uniref:Virulence factor Mce-like protein n=1 Tax=Nocardia goodfellowii TaxID=882446 RepID=A0ABS4QML1_9NOCA|nr:MlaD family protein [Nocardia goodfellowii]MBP2192948.1 virulence factor Mce-like protein [Nocardia goodfellowii]
MNPGSNPDVLESISTAIVSIVDRLVRHRLTVSGLALVATLLMGATYLVFGSLELNPLASTYQIRVHLPQSGGLLQDRNVTVRGVRVGRVSSVDLTGEGVVAIASIDSRTRIPVDTTVRVAGLSMAGEQYLDFVPSNSRGPYLADGAVVDTARASVPVQLAQLLVDLNGTIVQLDPGKLQTIVHELGTGPAAPEKLAAIIDGGAFLITTLGSVLPQTVSLLHHSEIVLSTLRDVGPGLVATANGLERTLAGVESMTGGFRTLVGTGPQALQTMDQIIADNSPTMVQLLGNLGTVARMSYLHVPAIQELFFPQERAGSTADAAAMAVHEGSLWALVNIYPRKQCDYDLPRLPAILPNFPEPYLYTYCNDPTLIPRGARNAPRPPGDDTAGPPPGADPLATADPTPVGPLSVPTPYGGAFVPSYVPPK